MAGPSPWDESTPPPRTGTSSYAIASLVLGCLPTFGIASILALVFGYRARREIDAAGGRLSGRGLATAGIVLGWIGLAFSALVALLLVTALISGASLR